MTELRAFIIETAKEAGKIMLEAVDIKKKQQEKSGDYNPVTAYDVAVQNFLFSALKKRLPEAKFIGEEVGTDTPTPLAHGYSFIIDPIDGTTNFIQNYRHSCTSIALLKDGAPYIGVVYNPYSGDIFSAEAGQGAWLNGEPIHASDQPLEDLAPRPITGTSRTISTAPSRYYKSCTRIARTCGGAGRQRSTCAMWPAGARGYFSSSSFRPMTSRQPA